MIKFIVADVNFHLYAFFLLGGIIKLALKVGVHDRSNFMKSAAIKWKQSYRSRLQTYQSRFGFGFSIGPRPPCNWIIQTSLEWNWSLKMYSVVRKPSGGVIKNLRACLQRTSLFDIREYPRPPLWCFVKNTSYLEMTKTHGISWNQTICYAKALVLGNMNSQLFGLGNHIKQIF